MTYAVAIRDPGRPQHDQTAWKPRPGSRRTYRQPFPWTSAVTMPTLPSRRSAVPQQPSPGRRGSSECRNSSTLTPASNPYFFDSKRRWRCESDALARVALSALQRADHPARTTAGHRSTAARNGDDHLVDQVRGGCSSVVAVQHETACQHRCAPALRTVEPGVEAVKQPIDRLPWHSATMARYRREYAASCR